MDSVVFRTVARGFAKDEVIGYIDNLDRQLTSLRQELAEKDVSDKLRETKAQLANANDQTEMLAQAVIERDKQIAQLEAQLSDLQEQSQFLTDTVNQLTEELAAEKDAADENGLTLQYQEQQLDALTAKNRELLDALNAKEQEQQAKDDPAQQVGEVIVEAHRIAAEIVKNAEDRARSISISTQLAVAKIASDISSFHTDLDSLSEALTTNTATMRERLDNMITAVEDTQKVFVDRFSE